MNEKETNKSFYNESFYIEGKTVGDLAQWLKTIPPDYRMGIAITPWGDAVVAERD